MSLAPAATKDGFSFAGDLYAEASGHNRHRRATVSELKEHFKSGSDKDHPAHWFEAQLIHYGLQPSKTKSVARMRLFDAVNAGKLAVPAHIKNLETDLKKEWTKNERQAKKAVSAARSTSTTSSTATGKKRKADSSNIDVTVNAGGINITISANSASTSSSAAKKAKTSTTAATSTKAAKDTPKKKAPAIKAAKDSPKPKKAAAPKPSKPAKPAEKPKASTAGTAKKQTARRGGISQGPSRGSASTAKTADNKHPRAKQTARRSGAFVARGRIPTSGAFSSSNDFEEPPPPYSEYDNNNYDDSDQYDDSDRGDDYGAYNDSSPSSPLEPLGLLNGRYDIVSREAYDQWGCKSFDLVLTLSGRELWGKFDLGVVRGIIRFNERPWESSYDRVPFTWRGLVDEDHVYSSDNFGWIKFLGGGRIEGELDYMDLDFGGDRASGQGTRSEIDARSMQREWDEYR